MAAYIVCKKIICDTFSKKAVLVENFPKTIAWCYCFLQLFAKVKLS